MSTNPHPLVFLHGAATGPDVYDATITHVARLFDAAGQQTPAIHVPLRPQQGHWDQELEALRHHAHGAFIVGVSGGATLGWELVSAHQIAHTGCVPRGAFLHEPAAGSLAPGLLAHVARALDSDGLNGFGTALYGRSWKPTMASADAARTAREFAMFSAFEPTALAALTQGSVLLSMGDLSPRSRHNSVNRMSETFGVASRSISGSHAVHIENPHALARAVFEQYCAISQRPGSD